MMAKRISFRQAARRLGVSLSSVVRWTQSGVLPHVVLNGRRYLTDELLKEFEDKAVRRPKEE